MIKQENSYFSQGGPAPIAVMGMHRSGTSCLTGLLQDAGVWLGKVGTSAPFNKKGPRENRLIMELHNDVLESNQASWRSPPQEECHWHAEHLQQLEAIIQSYPADKLWAFKDPRSCFTINTWKRLIPDLRLIGTFRHPAAVAGSLKYRGERLDILTVENEVALWFAYNKRLLNLLQQQSFPLICFDRKDNDYLLQVEKAFAELGLELKPEKVEFFDTELRHDYSHENFSIPQECLDLYEELSAFQICI